MNFIDSHCHLDYKDFEGNIDPVLERAKDVGIKAFLNICTEIEEAAQVIATAEKYPQVFATVGVHPHEAEPDLKQFSKDDLRNWLVEKAQHPKVVGLGETGLDFFYDNSPRDLQIEAFEAHVQAAKITKLPLIIHTRSANEETVDVLQSERGRITGVIHCFSETKWLADQAMGLGFYISIPGIITFKKSQELRDIVKELPLERLLLETDAPFLAPVPHRGKRNEPSFMIETAKVLADLKSVSLEEIARITTDNFQKLFTKADVSPLIL